MLMKSRPSSGFGALGIAGLFVVLFAVAGCEPTPGVKSKPTTTPVQTQPPAATPTPTPAAKEPAVPASPSSDDPNAKVTLTDEQWRQRLTKEQFYVLREKGTERAFTGKYWNTKEPGVYRCAGCNAELFRSDDKFDSGCGWPSFDREAAKGRIEERLDLSHGMVRTEILCARCGGHIGHVFDDGPTDTNLRYCVNSAAVNHDPAKPDSAPKPEAKP